MVIISATTSVDHYLLAFLTLLQSAQCLDQADIKGHLQPIFTFGDRHSVAVVQGFPSPSDFFRDFVSLEKPVLFQNAAKSFPAFVKWTDEYFLSFPESEQLQVIVESRKKESRPHPTSDVVFSTFLKYYRTKDIYMVDTIPQFLSKDVLIPLCLGCQNITRGSMIQSMMWLSSGGTQSVLHSDYAENINCVFKGSKAFFLVDRKYMDILNVTEMGYSEVDVDSVDLVKFPGLYNIEHYKVTVQAGDCLYIPFLWIHQVTSRDHNMAVNFWWKDKVQVDFDQCGPLGNLTVNDIKFIGFDSLHEAQYRMIKGRFLRRIRTKGPMTFEDLFEEIEEVVEMQESESQVDQKIREVVKKTFHLLDSLPTDGVVTREEVTNLTNNNLKTIKKYIASIMELHSQRQAEMEWLGGVEWDAVNEPPQDWIEGEMSPEGMVLGKNGPPAGWNSGQLLPEGVEWGTNGPPSELVKGEIPPAEVDRGDNQMTPDQEMEWREMVKNRKLEHDRREEL